MVSNTTKPNFLCFSIKLGTVIHKHDDLEDAIEEIISNIKQNGDWLSDGIYRSLKKLIENYTKTLQVSATLYNGFYKLISGKYYSIEECMQFDVDNTDARVAGVIDKIGKKETIQESDPLFHEYLESLCCAINLSVGFHVDVMCSIAKNYHELDVDPEEIDRPVRKAVWQSLYLHSKRLYNY